MSYLLISKCDKLMLIIKKPFTLELKCSQFFFYRELLKMFINPELIQWSALVSIYENILKLGTDQFPATDVFNPNIEEGRGRWKELKNRVVEHVSC